MSYLYHYTDEEGKNAILRSGYIKMSSGSGDAAFGEGVYLTAIPPTTDRLEILVNNWDDGSNVLKHISRTKYCFAIPIAAIPEVRKVGETRRDVWLYPKDLYLKGKGAMVYG